MEPDALIEASRQLDDRLSRARAFRWAAVAGGLVTLVLLVVLVLSVRGLADDTNDAVRGDIGRLERTIAQQEDVIDQAVAAIIQLSQLLRDNGIEPPEIVLRPIDEDPNNG